MNIDKIQAIKLNRLITDLTIQYGKRDDFYGSLDISYLVIGKYVTVYTENYNNKEYRFRVFCYVNYSMQKDAAYERWMAIGSIYDSVDYKCLYESIEKENSRETIYYNEEQIWIDELLFYAEE